jgi:hypothetical protein
VREVASGAGDIRAGGNDEGRSPVPVEAVATAQRTKLARCEEVIIRGWRGFVEVGRALALSGMEGYTGKSIELSRRIAGPDGTIIGPMSIACPIAGALRLTSTDVWDMWCFRVLGEQ